MPSAISVAEPAPRFAFAWPEPARVVFPALLMCLALVNLSSPRSFTEQQAAADDTAFLAKIAKALFVCIVGAYLASAWIGAGTAIRTATHPRLTLLIGFGLWSCATALSMVFGGAHVLSPQWLSVTGMTLALCWRMDARDGLIEGVRDALIWFAAGSLLLLGAAPDSVAQMHYSGWLPIRLAGLSNHPNSLAPLMLLGAVTLALAPYRRSTQNLAAAAVLLIALLLTQSKTTLAIGVGVAVAGGAQWVHSRWSRMGLPAGALLGIAGALAASALAVACVAAIAGGGWADRIIPWSRMVGDYTGRDIIWDFTLDIWRRDPWFGYGYGSLWNAGMRDQFFAIAAWRPGYSHSLYVQTLGESGIVGFGGVIIAALALLAAASTTRARFALMALVVGVVLVRGVTEVSWGTVAYSENAVIVFLLVALLIAAQARPGAAS